MSETSVSHEYARSEDVCGVFCDGEPTVSFIDEWGIEVHWCRDCYEKPCSHCGGWIEDENKRKGMCQDRRDEIRMWGGDEERGVEKEPDNEQTTLLTDGGTETEDRRFVAVGDMDKLGVCSECGGVTMWIAVEETEEGHEVVPFCSKHHKEVLQG